MSRNASASQRPHPRIACCRQGPGSPAASARIQPVLRRSSPSSPSRNTPAEAATHSCVNNGRIRAFTSRNDAAHSSNVSSIDAPLIHPLPTIREKIRTPRQKCNCSVRLLLSRGFVVEDQFEAGERYTQLFYNSAHPPTGFAVTEIAEPTSGGGCRCTPLEMIGSPA